MCMQIHALCIVISQWAAVTRQDTNSAGVWSQDAPILHSKHHPHCTHVLGVWIKLHSKCMPHMIPTATYNVNTYRRPKQQQQNALDKHHVITCELLQTTGKHLVRISVYKLDREAFEGVPLRHCPSYGFLELLVSSSRHSNTSFKLVRSESRCQQIAQVIIPLSIEPAVLKNRTAIMSCRAQQIIGIACTSSICIHVHTTHNIRHTRAYILRICDIVKILCII